MRCVCVCGDCDVGWLQMPNTMCSECQTFYLTFYISLRHLHHYTQQNSLIYRYIKEVSPSFACIGFTPVNLVYLLDYPLVAKTYLREYLPINQSHPDSTTNAERNTIENTKAKIGQ